MADNFSHSAKKIMGKVRVKKRCRLHLKTVRVSDMTQDVPALPRGDVVTSSGVDLLVGNNKSTTATPLPEEIMQSLPVLPLNEDVKNEPRALTRQRTLMKKKKDKRKLRHETWLKKIDICRLAKEESKAREERKKTVVVGDMQPLVNALLDLPILTSITDKHSKKGARPIVASSSKTQHRAIVREVDHFQDVLKHPAYKEDPLGAITQHIQNSVTRELT